MLISQFWQKHYKIKGENMSCMSKGHYQTLTVNVITGTTNWQKPQQSIEDAIDYAYRRTRKLSDFFVYEISSSKNKNINLVKTIRYNL